MYKRVKAGQENYRNQYIELARTVKKLTRTAKKKHEIKVVSQVKTVPKGFFQIYRTRSRELVGPLKIGQEEMVSLGEDMCKVINYLSSVFTEEDKHIVSVTEQIF